MNFSRRRSFFFILSIFFGFIVDGCAPVPSLQFNPYKPIDTGIQITEKVSLAIAPFKDKRPFINPEKPETYHYIRIHAASKGLDIRKSVDWSEPETYTGFLAKWSSTEKTNSEITRDAIVSVFNQGGFNANPLDNGDKVEKQLLAEANDSNSEYLLVGEIKHFQVADRTGAIGGIYYLLQTIELDVKLLRVEDGSLILTKNYEFDREESDPPFSKYKTLFTDRILLNHSFPQVLERMIFDVKDAILKASEKK